MIGKKRKQRGCFGEELVSIYLERKGFTIIGRNIHSRFGEIDIIALYGGGVHIIEVKTRYITANSISLSAVSAVNSIDTHKLRRMRKTVYSPQVQQILASYEYSGIQYDFAAVDRVEGQIHIRLFWNISMN